MKFKQKALFSDFTFENWRNLILAAIVCFYLINIIASFGQGAVGDDFVAYWSAGRISDEKGYSNIYDLANLKAVYNQMLKEQGYSIDIDNTTYSTPYLPVFVIPFQFLSRIDLPYSFWSWNFINSVVLFGYLTFFLRRIDSDNEVSIDYLYLLVVTTISYPVFKNLTSGNINVFLLICTGEFLRNAIKNKPFYSGLWLGGLLLKPLLLTLIIPVFLITRHWKVLKGFAVSSGFILIASVILAGFTGMKGLVDLWIKYPSDTFSNTAPEIMINWRMVGFTLDNYFDLSIGWGITGIGIIFTLVAVYFLIKKMAGFGSSSWVVSILGIFAATIAMTWHSHFYTAMVLIPFIIYASVNKLLPEKIIFLWAIATPVAWFGFTIFGLFDSIFIKIGVIEFQFIVIAFSGFIMNLIILFSTVKNKKVYTQNDSQTQFADAK